MHFNFTSCYLSSITLKASDALSPKFPLCSPPSPGWSQLLLGQEQQVTGQGEPIEEFKMWAILPQSALLSFFPCQLLVFTQPCRNLIFARLLPHTEFDTWQWVQTFTRWRKVDCSVFYRQILHRYLVLRMGKARAHMFLQLAFAFVHYFAFWLLMHAVHPEVLDENPEEGDPLFPCQTRQAMAMASPHLTSCEQAVLNYHQQCS